MLLKDKVAVIYGAGGSVGGAVARAFAREGASVFLTGRTLVKVQAVADAIRADTILAAGDIPAPVSNEPEAPAAAWVDVAEVDALDPQAIEEHLDTVIQKAGRIDITFNAIWIRGDLQGTPLMQMNWEDMTTPVLTGVKTHFLTATAAARRMVAQRSGVILTLSTSSSVLSGRDRRFHRTGGFSTACAAIEAFSRTLAGELGPQGIRVVCLRPDALPETWPPGAGEIRTYMENGTALGRLPTLEEVGSAAALMASDYASAITGAIANLTCGSVMD
jgi:NAD(P)-dependent dehydrogenase (short-subunit alcohol dehydrogenase family)